VGGERGDAAEITAFCRDEHPRLVGLLGLYCGDAALAEDLALAALVRVVDDWPRTRALPSPGARLLQVGMALADRRRRPPPVPATPADARAAVRAALGQVPRRERQVLLLRLYAGCSLADTATVLRLPPGVVASLTARGLRRLRAAMGDWWPRRSRDEETPAPLPAAPASEPGVAEDDDHELWRPPPPRGTASAWLAPESGSWGVARGG